ncbi:transposable element Tcb2 transposase [Trichonephila clavipes]|nr:transposable element Tcb2 transposase [Trichonephila clavipes]
MNFTLKAHCHPPINDHLHSRCLLHSHWTSSSEVTPPLQAQVSKIMNIRDPDKGRAEVDMPLRRFRRQYEQLSQFEGGRIIGMMEARRVARQLGCSDCVVRRCWDKWIREMSFTRRQGSGRPRQISH